MVQSYNTLLAEGSIGVSNRPQSANSRARIDTAAAGRSTGEGSWHATHCACPTSVTPQHDHGVVPADVKVFANSLYDAGDILAGQPDPPAAPKLPTPQPPPMSPLSAGGSQKFQQQRVMAAQVSCACWPAFLLTYCSAAQQGMVC